MNLRSIPLLASVVLMAGCGAATPGSVAGKVSYQGKAIVSGTIILVGSDNVHRPANIEPDGSFTVMAVPSGQVRVGVTSPEPPPTSAGHQRQPRPGETPMAAPPPVDRSKWFKIPEQLGNPDASGVTITVKPGSNTINVDFK